MTSQNIFKAADLEHEKKFRIKSAIEEEIERDQKREKKLVVWFTNDERGLVLNKQQPHHPRCLW